ncbi:MAG: iron ABC transporter permease [Deltaproteobacteria bacterium]|nr:iron ABC transporter permease [Deltaproteobacteria bacterium]
MAIKKPLILPVLVLVLCLITLVSLSLGKYPVSIDDLFRFLCTWVSGEEFIDSQKYKLLENIFFDIRFVRIAAAILIGAALSVSGASFQSIFMNPLVSPGLLGVLSGASFGAALGMIWGKNWIVVQIGAFSFGLIAVLAAFGLSALSRGAKLLTLILGGIISGALFTSLLSLVKYVSDPYDQLPAIVYWLMGGLSYVDKLTLLVVSGPILCGIIIITLLSGYLNILSMGDEEARSLGLNVTLLRFIFIFLATVISALTVVMGGVISWVGLIIPHISRMLVGPDNRIMIPVSALIGAIYLLVTDDIARLVFNIEIPIGILTSLVGIPFFAFVLPKARKGWS